MQANIINWRLWKEPNSKRVTKVWWYNCKLFSQVFSQIGCVKLTFVIIIVLLSVHLSVHHGFQLKTKETNRLQNSKWGWISAFGERDQVHSRGSWVNILCRLISKKRDNGKSVSISLSLSLSLSQAVATNVTFLILYLTSLQLVLCLVAAVKRLPVHQP